jgi:hypothetical protein
MAGPSRSTGALATEDTVSTACGLPIDTAPISTSVPRRERIHVRFADARTAGIWVEVGHAHVDGDEVGVVDARANEPAGCRARSRRCHSRRDGMQERGEQRTPLPHCSTSPPSALKMR